MRYSIVSCIVVTEESWLVISSCARTLTYWRTRSSSSEITQGMASSSSATRVCWHTERKERWYSCTCITYTHTHIALYYNIVVNIVNFLHSRVHFSIKICIYVQYDLRCMYVCMYVCMYICMYVSCSTASCFTCCLESDHSAPALRNRFNLQALERFDFWCCNSYLMRNYVVVYVCMYVCMYVWLLTMLNSFAFVNRKFLQCIILYCFMYVCVQSGRRIFWKRFKITSKRFFRIIM